jgi:hypothetical protein
MREHTRERLDRLRRHEMFAWLPAAVLLVLLFGAFFALRTTVRGEREVAGTVQSAAWRVNEDTGQRYPDIEVVLGNRAVVRVGSIAPALPEIGSQILLRKRRMLLGYTTYRWEGELRELRPVAPPAATPVSLP